MHKSIRLLTALLALIVLIGACAPGESPEEVEARISTSVAQTVAARDQMGTFVAQTVAAQRTTVSTPTATLGATATLFPTVTPLATSTPFVASSGGGGGGGGGSGGGSSSTTRFACAWTGQKPNDGTKFNPEVSFDVVWTIKNTGTKPILASDSSFQRIGGDPISPTANFGLASNIKPGDSANFRVEVETPELFDNEEHIFITIWALVVDGVKLCKVDLGVRVQRPPW